MMVGYMRWKAFLAILSSVKVNSLETKLSLFFSLMDTNKNGLMNFEQIQYLCRLSLQKVVSMKKQEQDDEQQKVIDELAHYLASLIYKANGLDQNQEIDITKLKEILTNNGEDVDIMLMMCCAEKQDEHQSQDIIDQYDLNAIIKQQNDSENKKVKKLYDYLLKYRKNNTKAKYQQMRNKQYTNKQMFATNVEEQKSTKPQTFKFDIDEFKNKFEKFQPELAQNVQNIVRRRRLNSKDFLNEQAAMIESNILMCFGIVPAFVL